MNKLRESVQELPPLVNARQILTYLPR